MAGLSMGGMQTASVTMANLDKFSHIGFFSGGTDTGGAAWPAAPLPGRARAAPPRPRLPRPTSRPSTTARWPTRPRSTGRSRSSS